MKTRKITLTLPEDVLRRTKLIANQEEYADAQAAALRSLRDGYDLGTEGRITWTRESLYRR